MKNGQIWQDVSGRDIQAHGGCIIRHGDTYYWYGENKGIDNCPGTHRVDVVGVSCYSSRNLVDWKYEGLALRAEPENPHSPLHPSRVAERPKVIFNEKTAAGIQRRFSIFCQFTHHAHFQKRPPEPAGGVWPPCLRHSRSGCRPHLTRGGRE